MHKILVTEDSPIVRKILFKLIEDNPHFQSVLCEDLASAQKQLNSGETFLAAIVDLNLPDAPNGEIVDIILPYDIPTIVLTGNFDEHLRHMLLDKGVLDYITKESRYSYMQVVKLIDRLRKNLSTKVLVADDSLTSQRFLSQFLQKFRFNVVCVNDGVEALAALNEHKDIKLVISDYMMPNMDGFQLVKRIRQERQFQDLIFIGLSATGNSMLSAKFIKSGANDFLSKPFYHEEFFCRVLHSLELQEMMAQVRDSANIDPLTNTYNRRFLFEHGESLLDAKVSVTVAIIDVDDFKPINDTYGHKTGDKLLEAFSLLLKRYFSDDLVARYGGEEFVVLSERPYPEVMKTTDLFMQKLRELVFTEHKIAMTCSIGVSEGNTGGLEELIDVADKRLYRAKHTGKNRVIEMLAG
ncbi:diguanylate cyclase [Aestuariibacter sp. GS-14]|uniref:diguanylate cyclase n=1 Tax=Aestuariibacter sp. GS-14 TaxID=2590670 RepID=UPI00112B922F|nr:diguanylate cyclase [Aestuariibacter sp. GS-14]TPV61769.1 diguanylate cyclase [Aestuariibacter sp. GS-14]